jgi:NAD-dependent DNA ligase
MPGHPTTSEETAELLASRFAALDKLMAAMADELEAIESIGPRFPRVYRLLSDPGEPDIIKKLMRGVAARG